MKRIPKNWKYKRTFDKKIEKVFFKKKPAFNKVGIYNYGLIVKKSKYFTYEQLFTFLKIIKKFFKKKAQIKINVSCVMSFTKKPVSARMGKGKGAWKGCNILVRKGTVILEIVDYNKKEVLLALNECKQKASTNLKIIKIKI